MVKRNTGRVVLPAGHYVVSDPCYVLSDARYRERDDSFLTQLFDHSRDGYDQTEFKMLGHRWACFNTTYGDGSYMSNIGVEFSVDAGSIACMPLELADKYTESATYTHDFYSDTEFECYFEDKGGVIVFGDIRIITDEIPECPDCGDEVHSEGELCWSCQEREDEANTCDECGEYGEEACICDEDDDEDY